MQPYVVKLLPNLLVMSAVILCVMDCSLSIGGKTTSSTLVLQCETDRCSQLHGQLMLEDRPTSVHHGLHRKESRLLVIDSPPYQQLNSNDRPLNN